MEELLDTAPCGFFSFTDHGIIIEINTTLLGMLGYSREELTNQKVESIFTLSSRIFYQTHFFPLITLQGKAEEIFLSLRTKSKEDIPVLANAVRRQREAGIVNECILIPVPQRRKYEDEILLARRRAEEAARSNEELVVAKRELEEHTQELDRKISQLEQINREHLRVSQILFHDLREPLRKVATFMDLLLREHEMHLTSSMRLLLDRIQASLVRMEELLRALQQFTAVDGAEEPLVQVDLNEVVATAESVLLGNSGAYSIAYKIQSETLPVIEGYHRQLVTLFSQLLDNSVKFRKPDSTLTIHISHSLLQQNSFRASKDRYRYIDFVKITFQDNGSGFDGTYKNSLFQLLKKLDLNSPGLGIGLAICKKVVENHSGSIEADSVIGQGATFTILLPLHQQVSPLALMHASTQFTVDI
jgi:sigma-B regulation protein RsbU (phosphoserine phosphatase)